MGSLKPSALLVAATLLLAGPAFGLRKEQSADRAVYDSWVQENGLPQNSANALARTPDGYLFIGTEEGISRFDGVRFVNLPLGELPQMRGSDPSVNAMLVDRSGVLWASFREGVLIRFGPHPLRLETGTFATTGEAGLYEDREGRLWLQPAEAPLLTLSGERLVPFVLPDGSTVPHCRGVQQTPDGTLWIATKTALFRLAGGRASPVDLRACGQVIDHLFQDRDGHLWLAMRGEGLCGRVDLLGQAPLRLTSKQGLASGGILAFYQDLSGTYWVATVSGINRVVDDKVVEGPRPGGVLDTRATGFLEDPEGSLWIGTETMGLRRLRAANFVTYGSAEGLTEMPWALLARSDGSVLVGTDRGGLFSFFAGRIEVIRAPTGLPEDRLRFIAEAPAGGLLLAANQRIDLWKDGAARPFAQGAPPIPGRIRTGIVGPEGELWLGTTDGLFLLHKGALTALTLGPGQGRSTVHSLMLRPDGVLLAATNQGLARVEHGKVTLLGQAQGLPTDLVLVVREDRAGVLWLGTQGGGLVRWKGGEFFTIGTAQGLADNTVWELLEDEAGRVWMTSNHGISWVLRQELEAVADRRQERLHPRIYGRADGLRTLEFNGGNQENGVRAKDGRLWWPTIQGVVVVDPARLTMNPTPPPVIIEEFVSDGRDLPVQPGATVQAGSQQLSLTYTALSFVEPERMRFRYRLLGFDSDWVEAGARRVAFYTGLAPGEYQFQVIACNSDGVWNEKGARLTFRVLPFYWQTGWFFALGLFFAGAFLLLLYRLRIRQLKARAQELEATVEVRTKDLLAEKEKSERLLLNILPQQIAERLKARDGLIAERFESVTILFADLVGFSDLSSRVSPEALVELLNDVFTRFDRLAERYGAEKIKTIGDAYMVVAGVPKPRDDHAKAIAQLALEMVAELERLNMDRGLSLQVRIGINTGPVVAGVIGKRKFSYDLWGDAVNTASRMESHGAPGRIQLSASSRSALGPDFEVEARGTIDVKGKGPLTTFWLLRRQPF